MAGEEASDFELIGSILGLIIGFRGEWCVEFVTKEARRGLNGVGAKSLPDTRLF